MLARLIVRDGTVSLVCEALTFERRRPLEAGPLSDICDRYAKAREHADGAATLLTLGRELYHWLDGTEGWLGELRPQLTPPFLLDVEANPRPGAAEWPVLHAPWELLADETGHLAEDAMLGFAPARRLGQARTAPALDSHRLGIAFMAAAPLGQKELDHEAEEAAILGAAAHEIDLYVEDSGDPVELGRRLATFTPALPVLHLSCHGSERGELCLESATGDALPTTAEGLTDALGETRPRLLFLSACLSANGVADSLAARLAGAGLPAVLGWDGSVRDVAATAFARALYDGLGGQRRPITAAAAAARRALLKGEGAGPGLDTRKDAASPARAALAEALRRDWHLARVWLGPEGGGPVVGGKGKRSMLPHDHEYKQLLTRKGNNTQLVVTGPEMFVNRRRELQEGLRILRGDDHAGLLLHGMGRLGKSSLAARLASRRHDDLTLAVVYGRYDALSVLTALEEALAAHEPARQLLAAARPAVRDDRQARELERVLTALLAGPCAQTASGKPVLLLIDDLEPILEDKPYGPDGKRRVKDAERPVLRALLRAFDPARSDSRLLLTSRFPFTLIDDREELANRLHPVQLAPFSDTAQQKLSLRQQASTKLDQKALADRLPLQARAQALAHGNPGLQDLIGGRLALAGAVPIERVKAVLEQMADYLAGGKLPSDQEVADFLRDLAVDTLLDLAGDAGQALLRALLLFELPVPEPVVAALTEAVGGTAAALRALALLDPHPDPADPGPPAVAVSPLAAGRLAPLTPSESAALATLALPALFAAWGGVAGGKTRTFAQDIELARLALLADDADVLAACAGDAVRGLAEDYQPKKAAHLGEEAIARLEAAGQALPLGLLAETAAALATTGKGEAATAVLAKGSGRIDGPDWASLDPAERSRFLSTLGDRQFQAGELDAALASFHQVRALEIERRNEHQLAVATGSIADILGARGQLDEALRIRREEQLPVYQRLGDVRSTAVCMGNIADILEARGKLDEALRIRREEELPVYQRLGDVRSTAVTMGQIADIFVARGQLDEALRIRREEELPVYQRLGDVRETAVTMGQIADILGARGQLDEALRILGEDVQPALVRLGDVRMTAVCMGKIADILGARGQLDEALRIRREEELPVYQRLGDVCSTAVCMGNIADILVARGQLDEALRIRREEQLPVYQRLGDTRNLLVAQGNIAQILLLQGRREDRPEAAGLLAQALAAARAMAIPEAAVIENIIQKSGLDRVEPETGRAE